MTGVASTGRSPIERRLHAHGFGIDRPAAAVLSVTVVWASVVVASACAPAIVTGADRERLAVAPIADWLWGALATGLILLAAAVSRGGSERLWTGFTVLLAAIWTVMAVTSVFAPDLVVGSDQTRIPLAALISPLAATVATAFACVFTSGSARET